MAEMNNLKMALFSPEFTAAEHTQHGKAHTFKFKTQYIDVDNLASSVKINGQRLEDRIGPEGHRYLPHAETNELAEIFVVSSPAPYQPYLFSVTLTEGSPHFRDFMQYWKKQGK